MRNSEPIDENSIFTIAISNYAFKVFDKNNRSLAVNAEAGNVAKNFRFSSFLCVLALSTVVGRPIESYFPVETRDTGDRDVYEMLFNICVLPRTSIEAIPSEPIHIFTCCSVPAHFIASGYLGDVKNHHVPLVDPFAEFVCFEKAFRLDQKPANQDSFSACKES